jgi:hypothetical protein
MSDIPNRSNPASSAILAWRTSSRGPNSSQDRNNPMLTIASAYVFRSMSEAGGPPSSSPFQRFDSTSDVKSTRNVTGETGLYKYAAQPTEYQNTSARFAVLLVLDKTVGAEGAVNLFESIWIEKVQREGETDA